MICFSAWHDFVVTKVKLTTLLDVLTLQYRWVCHTLSNRQEKLVYVSMMLPKTQDIQQNWGVWENFLHSLNTLGLFTVNVMTLWNTGRSTVATFSFMKLWILKCFYRQFWMYYNILHFCHLLHSVAWKMLLDLDFKDAGLRSSLVWLRQAWMDAWLEYII